MANWGLVGDGGASPLNDGQITFAGGDHSLVGQELTSISVKVYNSVEDDLRVALYSGGTLTDVSGATLLEDLGVITLTGNTEWLTINSTTNPLIPEGALLWIGLKSGQTNVCARGSAGAPIGDFDTRLRIYNLTERESNVPWPTNPTSAGSVSSGFVPNAYITTQDATLKILSPDTITEGTPTTMTGLELNTVVTTSIRDNTNTYSVTQATTLDVDELDFTPRRSVVAPTAGTPQDGVPVTADIVSPNATPYQLQLEVKDG